MSLRSARPLLATAANSSSSIRTLCAAAAAPSFDRHAKRREARVRARRGERADSINEEMQADREAHAAAIEAAWPDGAVIEHIKKVKLGRPKNWHNQGLLEQRRRALEQTLGGGAELLGKTGIGMHNDWDRLNRASLPEVAIMGHANCGKSSLLNALAATYTRKGPAAVSSRAGWTAELAFYKIVPDRPKLRKKAAAAAEAAAAVAEAEAHTAAGPMSANHFRAASGEQGVVLVDTPGYGFTVGSQEQLQTWGRLIGDYLDRSPRLRLALVLVDCTRGLCAADVRVLTRLRAARVPALVALTKSDLLGADALAGSHAVVAAQLAAVEAATAAAEEEPPSAAVAEMLASGRTDEEGGGAVDDRLHVPRVRASPHPLLLSGTFYVGVNHLWNTLLKEIPHLPERSVRE